MNKKDIFKFRFDSDTHTYYDEDGVKLAGTTSAIGELRDIVGLHAKVNTESASIMDLTTLSGASKRGTRLHNVVEHYIKTEMGDTSLSRADLRTKIKDSAHYKALENNEEKGAFDAWEAWRHTEVSDYEFVHSELELGSRTHRYAGTADAILRNKKSKDLMLADWKFGGEIPEGLGQQTAAYAEAYLENYREKITHRAVVNIPSVKEGANHLSHYIKSGTKLGEEFFKEDDFVNFIKNLHQYQANGLQHAPVSIEKAKELAQLNLYRAVEHSDWPGQYVGIKDLNNIAPEEQGVLDFYKDAASELGYKVSKTKPSRAGKGLNMTFERSKEGLNSEVFKKIRALDSSTPQKKSLLGSMETDYLKFRNQEIGSLLNGVQEAGSQVGSNFMSSLSKTENLKYAAIGGAIGYVGGATYAAMKNNDDPGSMYKEERHLLGSAIKGGAVLGTAAYVGNAVKNIGESRYQEEFVGSIFGEARGMCKTMSKAIVGAWQASGAIITK